MHDLLTAPLLRATPLASFSLPGLLAALARDEVRGFPAMRPHQRPAVHMFLVQLAVLAMRGDNGPLPHDEAGWSGRLLAMTDGDPGPWALLGPPNRPAFMQPAEVAGLKWTEVPTPDALDMLITSKNHDLKGAVATRAAPEDWIFALISLQTMEGYGGRGNHGIARMNGGSSSRPLLGLAPMRSEGVDPSAWWRRDVEALRLSPPEAPGTAGAPSLLWTLAWSEGAQLALTELDPLCIEVCRRVRLDAREGRIVARRATSAAARIEAKAFKGATGDPWGPVHLADGKGLTLGARRFGYRLLSELLWGNDNGAVWSRPPLGQPHDGETGPMLLVAEAFARGNSRTDGFMSRIVPVPSVQVGWIKEAGEISQRQIDEISRFDRALRDGLALLAGHGNRENVGPVQYALTREARAAFDAEADSLFFPALWARLAAEETGDEAPADAFRRELFAISQAIFHAAMQAMPCPSALRPKAEVMAELAFRRSLRAGNPWTHVVMPTKETGDDASDDAL